MNIMGILRTIVIIVAVYYLITLINRYIINRYIRRVQDVRNEYEGRRNRKKEGEVTLHHTGEKKKRIQEDVGEYIPYEEVKEEKKTNEKHP